MPRRAAWVQLAGVLLFSGAMLLPAYHLRTYPGLEHLPPGSYLLPEAREEVPAAELLAGLVAWLEGRGSAGLWAARRWYPFALAPLWLLALLAAGRVRRHPRPAWRRGLGLALLGVSAGVAAFEWAYLHADYVGFLGPALARAEVVLAWGFVLGLLFWRRRGAWSPAALEATVAAQALLALVHACTLPSTDARCWWDGHELGSLCRALGQNYRPAFWVGLAGLLLAALPAYLGPRPGARGAPADGQREISPSTTSA